jgi:hypothetical protein
VTASVRQALANAGWSVISVETITSNHPSVVEERWRDNYSKLHLFSLQVLPRAWPRVARSLRHPAVQEYDVVMFIDADAVVLGDLQVAASSFQYLGFTDPGPPSEPPLQPAFACSAPLCAVVDVWLPVFFNTGFMVLRPNSTVHLRFNCNF